jgi:hypothetical protein
LIIVGGSLLGVLVRVPYTCELLANLRFESAWSL